jgi:hypothetical protein
MYIAATKGAGGRPGTAAGTVTSHRVQCSPNKPMNHGTCFVV